MLLGAAAALGAGRPRWQLVCRSGRGNLRTAVGGLAQPRAQAGVAGSSLLGARGWGRAERPGRSAGREGDAERPRSAARRALPPDRPPSAGAALPRWRASRTCSLGGPGASSSRCRFSATAGAVPGRRARSQPSAQSQRSAWWRPLTACRPWARPRPAASIPLLAPHPDPTPPRPRTKRL